MKTVVAAALGECVHVAGVMKFIQLGLTDLSAHELTRYVFRLLQPPLRHRSG